MVTQTSRPPSRWRQLWLIDPRSLALFRIGAGTLLVIDLVGRLSDWRALYTDAGIVPRETVLARLGAWARLSVHMQSDAPAWVLGLFAVHLVAALALMLGWRTRVATVACWLLTASLHVRNPEVVSGGDNLLRVLLFWSMFLPLGSRWSFDSRRGRGGGAPGLVPGAAILLQVCFMYWFTVALKWTPAWLGDRSAVAMALELDYVVTAWGRLLRGFPTLLAWATTGTMLLEAIGPLLAFSPWRTGPVRFGVVFVFVQFHLLGLGAALHLGLFSWIVACAWLLFLPSWFWRQLLRSRGPENEEEVKEKPAPPDRERRGVAQVARDAIVATALIWILAINLATVWPSRFGGLLPAAAGTAARVLGIQQAWYMFAPAPPSEDGWYVVPGLLEDGEVVDLWSGGPVRFDKPEDVAVTYRDGRWRRYLSSLSMSRFSGLRPPFVRWLCRRWNATAEPGRRAVQVDLYYVMERYETPDAAPEPIFLLGAKCGPARAGSAGSEDGERVER